MYSIYQCNIYQGFQQKFPEAPRWGQIWNLQQKSDIYICAEKSEIILSYLKSSGVFGTLQYQVIRHGFEYNQNYLKFNKLP